jgi:GAF domain-containing protein
MTRKPALVRGDPSSDPRFLSAHELQDERFSCCLALPLLAHDDTLLGVITLQAEDADALDDRTLAVVELLARLVSRSVERASLESEVARHRRALDEMAQVGELFALEPSVGKRLYRLATMAVNVLDGELAIVLADDGSERLRVAAAAGAATMGARIDSVEIDRSLARLIAGRAHAAALPYDGPLRSVVGRPTELRGVLVAPLRSGGERHGLLCCYVAARPTLPPGRAQLLQLIADHCGLVLGSQPTQAAGAESADVEELLELLRDGDPGSAQATSLARRVGIRLADPHLAVHCRAGGLEDPTALWTALGRALTHAFPGSIVAARPQALTALVRVRGAASAEAVRAAVAPVLDAASSGGALRAALGYSDPARAPEDYAAALEQATVAATIGEASPAAWVVQAFGDLGSQRLLWALSNDPGPDPLQRRLERLAEHDRVRRTDLLHTLEAFVDHRGNVSRTADALFVHRNTLRQRLQTIAAVSGVALDEPGEWFDVALALRVLRLRRVAAAHDS